MAGRTYRYFTGEPLYPFGYGLSYTRFAYASRLRPRPSPASRSKSRSMTNAGARDGDEVVQLYVSHPGAPARRSGR
jgi:beta-glucosidase